MTENESANMNDGKFIRDLTLSKHEWEERFTAMRRRLTETPSPSTPFHLSAVYFSPSTNIPIFRGTLMNDPNLKHLDCFRIFSFAIRKNNRAKQKIVAQGNHF